MLPNELLLEVAGFLNKTDLSHLVFVSKNICYLLYTTETVQFYQRCNINMLENSTHSLFIFKTIYYSRKLYNKEDSLHEASGRGHLDVVKFSVTNGADLTSCNNYVIRSASESGHLEVVKFLVAKGADLSADNNSAFRRASNNGHLEVVKFLVTKGADLTYYGNSAIVLASSNGHLAVVKFLLANRANLTADNAVCWASRCGQLEVVKFLVENGADFTVFDNYAIYYASQNGHFEVVKFLVECGAKPDGKSIGIAKKYNRLSIANFLIASKKMNN